MDRHIALVGRDSRIVEIHGSPLCLIPIPTLANVHLVIVLGVPAPALLPGEDLDTSAVLSCSRSVLCHDGVGQSGCVTHECPHYDRPPTIDPGPRCDCDTFRGQLSPHLVRLSYDRVARLLSFLDRSHTML